MTTISMQSSELPRESLEPFSLASSITNLLGFKLCAWHKLQLGFENQTTSTKALQCKKNSSLSIFFPTRRQK